MLCIIFDASGFMAHIVIENMEIILEVDEAQTEQKYVNWCIF